MCGEYFTQGCGKPCHIRSRGDELFSLDCVRYYFQMSASSTMSENFSPSFVYHRRKHHKDSGFTTTVQPSIDPKPSDGCQSTISSVVPFRATPEKIVSISDLVRNSSLCPVLGPVECNQESVVLFGNSFDREVTGFKEILSIDTDRALDTYFGNNCSSSKSNLDLDSASLKIDMDDAGECSTSGTLSTENLSDISERDICLSILKSQGLLEKFWTGCDQSYAETGISNDKFCTKTCKVCEHLESTKNMLICDNCEDAFHVTCCYPHAARIPIGEWLCSFCLKKKHKIQKEKSTNSLNINNETGRSGNSTSEGELGYLEFMFRDTEPYMSNVRIGGDFQASVPYWTGPIYEYEFDFVGVPVETSPTNDDSLERISNRPFNPKSIGNWLQCQGIIDGIGEDLDGNICGKWRRAPIFEVQTDNWECFGCIHWDPAHADCAVPQELNTEEIVKQLKYVEMLRPRLAARKRKLSESKNHSQFLSHP